MKITTTVIDSKKNVYINNINFLYYDRADVFGRIGVNKTSAWK